jgi:LytS/YehU family sensor histidine kinase
VLAEIRFAESVRLDDAVDRVEVRRWCLPPLVLQELFENAVKHNAFDRHSPLDVRIECEGDDLIVSNRFRPRPAPMPSTRLGLRNLDERMRLGVGRALRWGAAGDRFVVRVPLVLAAGARQESSDRHDRQIAS